MQRSYRLVARLVRLLVDFKAGARVGLRNAAAQGSGAAGGAATVGRGMARNATGQSGAIKDFATGGGRTWWSHMPKTPQLPGALADAATSSGEQQADDKKAWSGSMTSNEEMASLDSDSLDVDLMAMRTETPADVLLSILSDMLEGRQPDLRDVALARAALLRHLDLYEPLNMGGHIRSANLDADVMDALMHQLGAASPASDPPAVLGGSHSRRAAGEEDLARRAAAGDDGKDDDDDDGGEVSEDMLHDAIAVLLGLSPLPPRPAMADAEVAEGLGDGGEAGEAQRAPGTETVPLPLMEEVDRLLALSDAWQYDTWRLAEVTEGHALSCLAFYLLHREGLVEEFQLRPMKLARLLRTLESGYPSNPYHNSTHAADVLQTFHVLLRGAGLTSHYLDRLGLLAAYMAAVVHDHGHPGLTADFLIATSNPLAVRYNDRSPLENHHGASFFELLQQPGMDALSHLPHAEKAAFRKLVLDLVMATDMKQHFSLLAHFNTAHHLAPYNKDAGPWALARGGVRLDRRSRGAPEPSGSDPAAPADEATGPVPSFREDRPHPRPHDETERTLSLQIALKVADLGHLGEELEVHKRWVRSLEEEFFRQGDREQQMGLPISPLFDRAKQGVSKSQVGFYDFIALPLVHALTSAFPGARPLLACFVDNYDHWRAAEKAAAEKVAQPHPHPHLHKQHSQHVMRVLEQQAQPASGASDATEKAAQPHLHKQQQHHLQQQVTVQPVGAADLMKASAGSPAVAAPA